MITLHQGEEPRLVELGRHHLGYGGGGNVAPRLVLELPNRQARFFPRRGGARQGEGYYQDCQGRQDCRNG